ncbi:Tetratricopeptide TPR_1 repeat-containing protein [Turneriella parva DSM 21527]|uniref:Tetratricopeptide TPR_1 repeat-containing protein n=2 Tax=Turneriella TaxID=338321 RepID=I4B645_TURPD|nr:Tetratricopeptide TPR_1 repeat-containing protein [Turneriella parva DSM 21527]
MRYTALLPMLLLLSACKPASEKAYEQNFSLRAARELDSTGNTELARYYLERARQDPAAHTEAENFSRRITERKLRTQDCLESKKTDLTINQYPRIRHKHLFQMGVCFEEAGDTARALKFYEMAENAASMQPQLFLRRALLHSRTGNNPAAAADFERAVSLNREYPPALFNLVLYRITAEQAEAAKAHLPELKSLKPNYADIAADALQHQAEIVTFMRGRNARR